MIYASNAIQPNSISNDKLPYKTSKMKERWVSDGMKNIIKAWKNYPPYPITTANLPSPILITAPTGTGKTYFILHDLVKLAESGRWSVLMIVNRKALRNQFFNDACATEYGYTIPPDLVGLNTSVKNLFIVTYQQFAGNFYMVMQKLNLPPNIRYVVMDEAHFFTSDALFNSETAQIFKNILAFSRSMQRIYMTATPKIVKDVIAYQENQQLHELERQKLAEYVFQDRMSAGYPQHQAVTLPITVQDQHDTMLEHSVELEKYKKLFPEAIYEYIFPPRSYNMNLKFFSDWDTIVNEINVPDDDYQWLIFVSDSEDGQKLYGDLKGISVFLKADKKSEDSEEIERLEQTSTFKKKVLIATSVLDNGINVKNDNCHNIVIDSSDSVQFLQMLGRKRVTDNETINLYVKNHTESDFDAYVNSIDKKLDAIGYYINNPYYFMKNMYDNCDLETRKMFAYNTNDLRSLNDYVIYYLTRKRDEYSNIKLKFATDPHAFAKAVCEWLNVEFSEDMMASDDPFTKAWAEIEGIIHSNSDSFDQKKLFEIRDDIWKILKPIRCTGMTGTKDDNRAKNTLNTNLAVLAKMGFPAYHVEKNDTKFSFCEGLE